MLSGPHRLFLEQIARAATANPFGPDRARVDDDLEGAPHHEPEVLAAILARLRHLLDRIGGPVESPRPPEERKLLERAVFFELFHRFGPDFEALIDRQLAAPTTVQTAPFVRDLLGVMAEHGFTESRSEHIVALFFQMHRAYRFIEQALTGQDNTIRRLRENLWNSVFTHDLRRYDEVLHFRMADFSTILVGETGTGKGAAAAAIGRSGFVPWDAKRRAFRAKFTENFISLNLSAFPETLVESELFGHTRGAFTGAVENHEGVFSRCHAEASLFLDEIGELSLTVQVKLLSVLQDRIFTAIGSREIQHFRGRVITATHRSLDHLMDEGQFRPDLYYRLCADVIQVPTLKARLADNPNEFDCLVEVILQRQLGEAQPELAEEITATIRRDRGHEYPWPGNVRELEQCVRRVLITGACRGVSQSNAATDEIDARTLVSRYCADLYERHGTYEKVARITGLDRRTVKKHILAAR